MKCDTCIHDSEPWYSEACDGCCEAHSHYQAVGESLFAHCKTCDHTEDECADCYPELGYKNTKLKRDAEAVKKFTESEIFQQIVDSLESEED